jgi:hypothetical protein
MTNHTDYYVQVANDGFSTIEKFWRVDATVAHQGIIPSQLGTHRADPGEEMIVTLRKRFLGAQFHKLQLAPGEYFPRMARPSTTLHESSPGHNPDHSPAALNIRTTSTGQLHALIQELQQICKVVHPIRKNFKTYGHEIRNIIIIASTEVEAHWKNILKANGCNGRSTREYVKLSQPMRLGEYRVVLPWYPWLEPIAPFENWMPGEAPTQRLPWYNDYNNIKHDRETNFAQATLINALKSVTGCFVMLCAQYGWDFARSGEASTDVFFRLIDVPRWEPSEIYVPPIGLKLKKRLYPFSN